MVEWAVMRTAWIDDGAALSVGGWFRRNLQRDWSVMMLVYRCRRFCLGSHSKCISDFVTCSVVL